MKVEHIRRGEFVRSARGEQLQVTKARVIQGEMQNLVHIWTLRATLTVTASHRVTRPKARLHREHSFSYRAIASSNSHVCHPVCNENVIRLNQIRSASSHRSQQHLRGKVEGNLTRLGREEKHNLLQRGPSKMPFLLGVVLTPIRSRNIVCFTIMHSNGCSSMLGIARIFAHSY